MPIGEKASLPAHVDPSTTKPYPRYYRPSSVWQWHPALSKLSRADCQKASLRQTGWCLGFFHLCSTNYRSSAFGFPEVGEAEDGSSQVGLSDVSDGLGSFVEATSDDLAKFSLAEIGIAEISITEVGFAEISIAEVGSTEISSTEIGLTPIDGTKISAIQTHNGRESCLT